MSIEEASQEQAAKKAKVDKCVAIASRLGWTDVEKGRECFVMKEKDGMKQWGSIFMPRSKHDLTDIWKKFVPKETLDKLIKEFNEAKNVIGSRKCKNGAARYDKHLILDKRKALQAFAVYIYICAKQAKPSEARKNGRFRRIQSMQALQFFRSKRPDVDKEKISGIQTTEVLLSRMLFTMDYTEELSKNFRSVVDSVGQHAAGDEKLFHFTGDSPFIRLVPAKPGKVGLWFYELCCKIVADGEGLPFMLDFFMHSNLGGSVPVQSVVERWAAAIEQIESQSTSPRDDMTWLTFDSYYATSEVRNWLIQRGQKFIGSVKPDRFNPEYYMIHRDGAVDKSGEWKSLKNIQTEEVFTYHWDTQKGVGKKYCISWGLKRTDSKHFVKSHEHRIPAYGYYKNTFEVCDNFNRGLHDRQWPLKRGGSGISGDLGCHHDFVMAVIMQNVRNAWLSVNQATPSEHSFEDLMIELATGLFSESVDL